MHLFQLSSRVSCRRRGSFFFSFLLLFSFVIRWLLTPPLKSSKVSHNLDLMNLVKTYNPHNGAGRGHGRPARNNHDVTSCCVIGFAADRTKKSSRLGKGEGGSSPLLLKFVVVKQLVVEHWPLPSPTGCFPLIGRILYSVLVLLDEGRRRHIVEIW